LQSSRAGVRGSKERTGNRSDTWAILTPVPLPLPFRARQAVRDARLHLDSWRQTLKASEASGNSAKLDAQRQEVEQAEDKVRAASGGTATLSVGPVHADTPPLTRAAAPARRGHRGGHRIAKGGPGEPRGHQVARCLCQSVRRRETGLGGDHGLSGHRLVLCTAPDALPPLFLPLPLAARANTTRPPPRCWRRPARSSPAWACRPSRSESHGGLAGLLPPPQGC
jgi:hypothetical protein